MQQRDTTGSVRAVMLCIYSLVVVCTVILSLQSLDGSQLEGWKMWLRSHSMVEGFDVSMEEQRAATALCRCGGPVTLVVDYIGYGVDIPEQVDRGVLRPLEYGRKSGEVQVCRKNLVTSYVHYSVEKMEDLLVNGKDGGVHLDMDGAYRVGWQVHDSLVEYTGDSHDGMVMHVILVDVSKKLDTGMLEFPLLGMLSEVDAIAVVDPRNASSLASLVHQVDAWLYGEGLVGSLLKGPDTIARACRVDATMNMKRLLNVIQHARHTRISPSVSSAVEDIQHDFSNHNNISMESSFHLSQSLQRILHSPTFGVEPRMPAMHVIALLMPFGLPLVFALTQSVKFLCKTKAGGEKPSQKIKEM